MKMMFFSKIKEKLRELANVVKSKVKPYAGFLGSGRLIIPVR